MVQGHNPKATTYSLFPVCTPVSQRPDHPMVLQAPPFLGSRAMKIERSASTHLATVTLSRGRDGKSRIRGPEPDYNVMKPLPALPGGGPSQTSQTTSSLPVPEPRRSNRGTVYQRKQGKYPPNAFEKHLQRHRPRPVNTPDDKNRVGADKSSRSIKSSSSSKSAGPTRPSTAPSDRSGVAIKYTPKTERSASRSSQRSSGRISISSISSQISLTESIKKLRVRLSDGFNKLRRRSSAESFTCILANQIESGTYFR